MKKTLGFLLLSLGLLFVGETTLARTQVMDANVQIEQGVSLSADEMQSIRGGNIYWDAKCVEYTVYCVVFTWSWTGAILCGILSAICFSIG